MARDPNFQQIKAFNGILEHLDGKSDSPLLSAAGASAVLSCSLLDTTMDVWQLAVDGEGMVPEVSSENASGPDLASTQLGGHLIPGLAPALPRRRAGGRAGGPRIHSRRPVCW